MPLKYLVMPSVGVHIEGSQMKGSSSMSVGPAVGVGLRVERDQYFFMPDLGIIEMVGLERSPLSLFSAGFIAGGHIRGATFEFYGGLSYRTILAYKVNPTWLGRVGAAFNFGVSGNQFYTEGTFGQYSEQSPGKITDYTNLAVDAGLRFIFSE